MIRALKLAPAPAARDPLRLALAAAIERHADAKRERDRIAAAQEAAQRRAWEAASGIERLAGQIAELQENAAQRAAAALVAGTAALADTELRDARRALDEARETAEALAGARSSLDEAMATADQNLSFKREALDRAAGAVLGAAGVELRQRVEAHLASAYTLAAALRVVDRHDKAVPVTEEARRRSALVFNLDHVRQFSGLTVEASGDLADKFQKAFDALKLDAEAVLPGA